MSKEQIEEIWNILTTDCDRECVGCEFENDEWCFTHFVANKLYNTGYHKQSAAEWVKQKGEPEAICSECGRAVVYQVIDGKWAFENYCPNCGAKMKGGE